MVHTRQSLEKLLRRLIAKKGLAPKENPFIYLPNLLQEITMTEETKAIPIEDLLDADLDQIADLPAFEVPPVGHYRLRVSLERKNVNDKPSIEAKLVVKEVLELADANAKKPEVGTKFSQLFMMDNEFGQGGFKEFVKPIVAGMNLPSTKVKDILTAVQNVDIAATVKHREHKDDKGKPKEERRVFANLTNVTVA